LPVSARRLSRWTDPEETVRTSKLLALDSARGVAALVVVFHHAACAFAPLLVHDRYAPWLRILVQGAFPVRFFFVLSGFVLSLSYFRSGRVAVLRSAAVRRFFRLAVPVAAAVALAYVLFDLGLYFNSLAGVAQHQPGRLRWLHHWYLFAPSATDAAAEAGWRAFFDYDTKHTYNNVLWTMGVEFRGSMFVFALLALIGGLRNRAALYLVVGLALRGTGQYHLIDFLAGAALCDWYVGHGPPADESDRTAFAVGLLMVFTGFIIGGSAPAGIETDRDFGGLISGRLWLTAAAVLVVAGILRSTRLQAALTVRPLVLLGKMSFSLYLVHVPIICSLSSWLYLWLTVESGWGHPSAAGLSTAAGVIVSLLLGWVGAETVEPFSIWLGRVVNAEVFAPLPEDDRIRQHADAVDADRHHVPGVQGEVVRRHDAGAGQQDHAVGEIVLPAEPVDQIL
jgi:peptidoglycan/LPS O-acetylase OafA/YrhL